MSSASRILRIAIAVGICPAAFVLSACVGDGPAGDASVETADAQPRYATYQCGEAGTMVVENRSAMVHVVSPRGVELDLPASPPTQRNRYGDEMHALVVEGREALWMANGKEPLDCRR